VLSDVQHICQSDKYWATRGDFVLKNITFDRIQGGAWRRFAFSECFQVNIRYDVDSLRFSAEMEMGHLS